MKESFIVNSKEKAMASEISLSKDLIDTKARNNHCVSVLKPHLFVLVCPCLFPNRTSLELKSLLSLFISFFQNLGAFFQIGGAA